MRALANRAADAAALAVLAGLAVQLFWRLGEFPGLHGDEAWVGLFSMRLLDRGVYTPHEMNTYTGALYGLLVGPVMERFGVSPWSLRLTGAALNPLAWLALWAAVRRASGPVAGLAWALLAATSGLIALKSRVAWEVYALQPLCAALALWSAVRLAEGGGRSWSFVLLLACVVGVQNHFIFLSLPAALALTAALLAARRPDGPGGALLAPTMTACLLGAAVVVVKPRLSEENWPALRGALLAAFWLAPVAGLGLCAALERRRAALAAALAAPVWRGPWPRRLFVGLLLACAWFHGYAFIETASGVEVVKRLASLAVPAWAAVPLYLWAAALVWAAFSEAWRRLEDGGEDLAPGAALLAVLPAAYAAVFIVFRNTSSMRYYVLANLVVLAALASSWPRRAPALRPAVLSALAAGGLGVWAVFAAALGGPAERPPLRFRVGWHREKSHDFVSKDGLWAFLERERPCGLVHDESMIDIPIHFRRRWRPVPDCDRSRSVRTRYCDDCARPPYIVAETVPNPDF